MSSLDGTAGETLLVSVGELEPHPLNEDIYTNRDISELVEKISEYGFREEQRLVVTPDGKILSGHRRWRAAVDCGLDEVPVEVKSVSGETEALETLLIANKYRQKTPAELINEGEAWEELESERAQERMQNPTQEFVEGETGEAKDKAAEEVGASKETLRKGQKVKEKAEQGDETAQEEWEQMEDGEQSISGAYANVKESDKDTAGDTTADNTSWKPVNVRHSAMEGRREDDGYVVRADGREVEVSERVFRALFLLKP